MLVRTEAVALNPTDWTTLDAKGDDGTIMCCDYAGVVEFVGSAVKRSFTKGDRVAGFSHGANDAHPEYGAFARYILVKGDTQLHIQDGVTFEAAASVGVGIATLGYGLHKILGLPFPSNKGPPASLPDKEHHQFSSTEGVAPRDHWQCNSPNSNFKLMKSRGADEIYDYRESGVGQKIRDSTDNSLNLVFDTIALNETAAICCEALGSYGGIYCNLLGSECKRSDVKSIFFLGYSMSGESYIFEGENYDASPEDFAFLVNFVPIVEESWENGKWISHPLKIEAGGLDGIAQGLQDGRDGNIRGVKVVYRVHETEWPSIAS